MNLNKWGTDGHEHVLMITNKENYDVDCVVCSQRCSGLTFNCIHCPLHAHKQCIRRPPNKLKSPYHPHMFALKAYSKVNECRACYGRIEDSLEYECGECAMNFHIECAFLVKGDVSEDQILHFTHLHPLSRGSEGGDDTEALNCKACDISCSGKAYYGCSPCKFFIHKSCTEQCMELLKQLVISFQRYTISINLLNSLMDFTCCVCGDKRHGLSYKRGEGSLALVMDVECALSIHQSQAQSSNLEDVYFTCHRHPLILQDKIENGIKVTCRACDKEICSGPTYGCGSCNYFFHTSCTEPKQITRPYHPHPLKLVHHWPSKVKCRLCHQDCSGAFYACSNGCDFALDVECGCMRSIIKFHGHPHPLVFVENIYGDFNCINCLALTKSSIFRCLKCDYYILDLKCGPIPQSVKSRHMHVLNLCDSYVEDDTGEDSCDVCEKRRDPGQAVYLCRICENKGCVYLAEIKCVMLEVISALKGDLGVVELRTVGTRVPGKVIPISESSNLQQEADQDEVTMTEAADDVHLLCHIQENLKRDHQWRKRYRGLWGLTVRSLGERKYEKLSDVIQFSDEAFQLLMRSLDYFSPSRTHFPTLVLTERSNQYLKLVKVAEDHMILQVHVPIYRDLVDKHGDVSKDCEASPLGKSYFFVVLLAFILRMRSKQVSHVTDNDLRDCHVCFKYLRLAGFETQFAFENLNKLARAYFGLQLVKFGRDKLQELDQQIARHLKAIEEQKAKLQVVRTEQEEHMRHMRVKKSRLMDKCWSEAKALKYKVGWELLL